jgi:ketosteroid isomerase-like protein
MSLDEEISSATEERSAAMASGDVKMLEGCLSDDLTFIAAAGALIGKAELIDNVRTGAYKLDSYERSDFKVKRYGDVAVAVYKVRMTSTFRGQVRSGNYLTTSVYAKESGRWKLAAQQSTQMAQSPVPAPVPTPRPAPVH